MSELFITQSPAELENLLLTDTINICLIVPK